MSSGSWLAAELASSSCSWCCAPSAAAAARAAGRSSAPATSKPEGERPQPRADLARRVRRDRPRVDAARQQHADRHIADHPPPDRVLEQALDLLDVGLQAAVRLFVDRAVPVLALAHAARVDGEHVPGTQPLDAGHERVRLGNRERREVVRQRGGIEPPLDEARRQQCLDLGAEDEPAARARVDERLDAEAVAREEQAPLGAVPDRQGPHAVESLHDVLAPGRVAAQHDLRVAAGAKAMARRLELVPQLRRVEDLAVVDDRERAVLDRHRLRAALDVDDGQAPADEPG